jgi:hypothetical protein
MAKKDELNNMNETAAELKKLFKELGGLVNELNSKLADSADLTGKVAENTRKTTKNKKDAGSLSKEFMDSEKNRENLQKRVLNMDLDQLKFLRESLKTGKGLNREKLKELGLDANIGKLAGAAAKTKMEHLGISRQLIFLKETEIKLQKTANRLVDGLIQGFLKADEETAKMGRNLNLSRAEAASLKMEFAKVAVASGDVAINSTRLAEANADLNSQLGTAVVFSGEMLKTTSKLTKLVGLSAEAAGSLAFQAQRSGQSVREVEENALAASYELQQGAGVALNLKDVLEASGKVSGQLRAQLGANPEEIAKAVTKAKLLGAELEDLANAGKQLLDFESSIESELEAELLTGKQLNLERARAAALAGDQATLADELAKNMGSFSDFTKMNTLQQDALAKSMGMSSDQLSDMLFKQETMGMNAQQLRAQGKGELADKLEQVSAQEKMNLLAEKFQGIMGDLATAFTPLLDTVAGIATYFASMPGVVGAIVSVMATLLVMQKALAIRSLIVATAKIFGENAKFGPGGIAIALGTIAAMGAAVGAAKATNMAQGGIVKPKAGGTIARIGEAGQPEAVIPLNKAKQMGFGGGGGAPQPIIINNTFDAFAASNGNGRKGLGGAQEMQASPTFA